MILLVSKVCQYFSKQHCTTQSSTTPSCIQFMEMKQKQYTCEHTQIADWQMRQLDT